MRISTNYTNNDTENLRKSDGVQLRPCRCPQRSHTNFPDVDDVADDLENHLETVERAEELDEKIEKTDDLIDEIVYELYGLTDEEIEIIEEAVGE